VGKMVADNDWGKAAVFKDGKIARAPLSELMQPPRTVPLNHPWIEMCKMVGIFV